MATNSDLPGNRVADAPWRPVRRGEIESFYASEFPTNESSFPSFISAAGPNEYAIAFGDIPYPTRDRGKRKFIRRSTHESGGCSGPPRFETFEDVVEFFRDPAYNDPLRSTDSEAALADPDLVDAPKPVARGVYFGLWHCERPWILAFDIDAKDVAEEAARENISGGQNMTYDELVGESGLKADEPSGFNYRFEHITRALEYGFEIESALQNTFNFSETLVVYSGQGCHVYGLDTDKYHRYDADTRQTMVRHIQMELGIPIDAKVTTDDARVLRIPYSLHTGVGRVVTPIDSPDFDFRSAAVPDVLVDDI